VVLTTIQVATPPRMRSEPITIDRVEAVLRIGVLSVDGACASRQRRQGAS
jgi:hypothetical protein